MLEVIFVSILVSLFGTWIRLVPRYPKWKYTFVQQAINIVLQSLVVTLLFILGLYPSWLLLFAMILFIVWLSVRVTNNIVKRSERLIAETSEGMSGNDEKGSSRMF